MIYRQLFIALTSLTILTPLAASADAVADLQARYRSQGAAVFDTAAGAALWRQEFTDAKTGQRRSCTLCHTDQLGEPGEHARTGKPIEPMAPSVNPQRLTDQAKIEKWFKRNCKWTLGRECTAQEKGDLLSFLSSQ
jgi:hypothetical protein